MIRLFVLALSFSLGAAACISSDARSAEVTKRFGQWEVDIDKDRFSGQTTVIAALAQDGHMLAVRCFPKGISIVIGDLVFGQGRFNEGMEFDIKFRADDKPIVETFGLGLSDKGIQVGEAVKLFTDMRATKEYAFRLSYKSVTFDMIFKGGKGSVAALGEVAKACNIN